MGRLYRSLSFSWAIRSVRARAKVGADNQNSDLLDAAEAAGFDVLVTTDKNLRYQQNLTERKSAIIVLLKQQWPDLRRHVHLVVAAIDAATPGAYTEVEMP